MLRAAFVTTCLVLWGAGAAEPAPAALTFIAPGKAPRTVELQKLEQLGVETVQTLDPNYHKLKRFRAVRLGAVLELGLPGVPLAHEELLLRARDGYGVFASGAQLLEPGGYLAIADADVPGWEPLGPRGESPGPFYLVWTGDTQRSPERYPRPWQLTSVELTSLEARYPHVRPRGVSDASKAMQGYRLFRAQCISCHAMNREGARIGPDLNVPQSIVEYRPEAQIRAYIVNPRKFRYGLMPPHPSMTTAELDALMAYFKAMKSQKHDPDRTAP